MPKPLKVRRVNEIVGAFVLLSLAVAVVAMLFGPRTRDLFTPTRWLAVQLPPEGSLGLRRGSDVQILGSVVGSVDDIVVTEAGDMRARVSVRGNFIRFVRQDSRAIIRKPLGIGEATIEITRGEGAPMAESGGVLASTADKGPTQLMDETLAAIRNEALPAIKEFRSAISEYAKLAAELREQKGAVQQALRHVNAAGAALERREGVAGMLLYDPRPAAELRTALTGLNASLGEVKSVLAAVRKSSEQLPAMGADAAGILEDLRAATVETRRVAARLPDMEKSARQSVDLLPGLLLQSQQTLYEIRRLAEAAQRSWLFRSGMDSAAVEGRLAAERVGTDR